jgi:hypothetical protein
MHGGGAAAPTLILHQATIYLANIEVCLQIVVVQRTSSPVAADYFDYQHGRQWHHIWHSGGIAPTRPNAAQESINMHMLHHPPDLSRTHHIRYMLAHSVLLRFLPRPVQSLA